MSLTTEAPLRAFKTVYAVVVLDDNSIVLDEVFENESARRTAIVDLLLLNHDEVTPEDVARVLDPFGGAYAGAALDLVLGLYAGAGVDIAVHLTERQQDVGPQVLFTTLTDYGDGSTVVEHYASREERLSELRLRASALAEDYPDGHFEDADEDACRKAIEYHVARTNGRIYLVDANRRDAAEIYIGFDPTIA